MVQYRPAPSSQKRRIAFDSGMQIVELIKKDLKPSDIITRESLRNAIIADLALGGSTNTFLHILAIANAGSINVTLDDFEELSKKVHQIVKINPSSSLTMTDFHNAGGVPAVIKSLEKFLSDTQTVSGISIKNIAKQARKDDVVIPDYDLSLIHI